MYGVVSEGRDADEHTASTPAVDVPPRAHPPSDDEVAPSPGSRQQRPVGAIRASVLSPATETDPIVNPAEPRAARCPAESRHVAALAPQDVPFAASPARAAGSAAPHRERRDDDAVGSTRPPPPAPRSAARAAAHAQEIGRLDQPPWPDGAPTEAGGLLFLLPVLARLGYERWLEDSPQRAPLAIDRRMLALVCARLALPPYDPAWRLCAAPVLPSPGRFCAPSAWAEGIAARGSAWRRDAAADGTRLWDASGRLLLAAWPGRRRPAAVASLLRGRRVVRCDDGSRDPDLTAAVTAAWLTACRRWLRRRARLGIATAVARPARLSLTPTHADVFFDLNGVSLAVRRGGSRPRSRLGAVVRPRGRFSLRARAMDVRRSTTASPLHLIALAGCAADGDAPGAEAAWLRAQRDALADEAGASSIRCAS